LDEDYIEDLDELLAFESFDKEESIPKPEQPYLSTSDYNRKFNLIKKLINLHKAKQSSKEPWSTYNPSPASLRQNLEDDFSSLYSNSSILTSLRHMKSSSLDLSDCSTDGDRVVVENFNLRADLDISDWCITRQVENMSMNRYKLPKGSIIKSGKVLRVDEPFQSSQIDFLIAIKEQQKQSSKPTSLKITTKLLSPDGCVKAMHTQEMPRFYHEIFKYANLIRFL
jgi:hypothetical protein